MITKKIRGIAVATFCLSILAGCGSGGGSSSSAPAAAAPPVVNAMPGGIFRGTITGGGTTHQVIGLIDENGNAAFVDTTSPGAVRFTVTAQGTQFTSAYRAYRPTGSTVAAITGTATGTITSRTSITGTATDTGAAQSSSFTLNYDNAYDTPAPFATSTGTYVFPFTAGGVARTATFTLSNTGSITGSDTSGCNFTGQATIPNAAFNAYNISLSGACNGTAVSATGLAAFIPATGGNPAQIALEYDNGNNYANAGVATKQ